MVIDTAAMVWRRRVSNDALGGYIYMYIHCIGVYTTKEGGTERR